MKNKKPASPLVVSTASVLATLLVVYVPIPVQCAETLIQLAIGLIATLDIF
jgi:hypothetical protein